jgi:SIR2-like domain
MGSRIPSWPGLVSRMMEDLRDETGGSDAFRELQNAGFSLPSITEFVEHKVDSESRFVSTLRACLYKDFPCRDIQKTFVGAATERIVEHIRSENRTLESVYNLAVQEKNDRLHANARIHCIVNFNLDSLMEAYDSARNAMKGAAGADRCLRTIEGPSHDRILGRINIYHPHGYLRFDRHQGMLGKEAATRVLAEHEFFDFYNRTTEVFTYTMLFIFREYHCLFIGMSMTDDNVRRLLFYSKSERDRSRAREGRSEQEPRHFVILCNRDMSSRLRDFTDTTLAALGVQPLWVGHFDEIPQHLGTLAE